MSTASPDSVLVYGILRAEASADAEVASVAGEGVAGRPVSVIEQAGLVALGSSHEDAAGLSAADPDDVLAHKAVVDRVFSRTTVIPVRFGTTVDDAASLRRHLHEEAHRYLQTLDRIDGRAEVGVRLSLRPGDAETESSSGTAYRSDRPGTAYLLARHRKRDGRRRRAVRTYRTELADWFDQMATSSAGTDHAVSLSFLVDRSRVEAFREAIADVRASGVESADVVGPWAPYSFV
jgi:hypothetical protein